MAKREVDTGYQMVFPSQAVSFDPEAFDDFIASHGIEFVHWRAMPCPVGMVDPDDIMRRPHDHHQNCSNGNVYTRVGEFTTSFISNSSDFKLIDPGLLDGSTVTICVPRFYDDPEGQPVSVSTLDRVYLKQEEITVTTKHVFAHHTTGRDRLQFPVVRVLDLMDSNGVRYQQGVDFEVVGGQLVWGDRRPGVDSKTNKGLVCSAVYSYRPFWYVKSLPHEVRVAQVEDADTGARRVIQMPQAAMLQREYVYEKEQRDARAPQDPKLAGVKPGPESGGFGPR